MMSGVEGSEHPPAQAECCKSTEENLRVELEGRMVGLEMKVEQQTREYLDTITALKECVILRDEKLEVLEEQIASKNSTIQQLSEAMKKSEEKVAQLMKTVESLLEKLEEYQNHSNENKDCRPSCENSVTSSQPQAAHPKKHKPKKTAYSKVTMESIFQKEMFSKFFTITVPTNQKKLMCPFETEKALCSAIGGRPVTITKSGKDGFMVEVANKKQSDKIRELKELSGQVCSVAESEFFNVIKGLFYLRNIVIEDFNSFKAGLMQEYQLKDVISAHWIKPKKTSHKAYIISTYQNSLPTHIRILGENTLAQVYPYHDSPLMCKFCQDYGHSKKRCSAKTPICGKCAQEHLTENCQAERFICHNCQGEHPTGHRSCPVRQKEDKILEVQKTMKVGRSSARRLLNGESSSEGVIVQNHEEYCRYVTINMESSISGTCPFKLEHHFKSKFGISRNNLRMGKNKFIVKCINPQQYNKVLNTKTLFNVSCSATPHKFFNESKGLIYLNEYNITNFEPFVAGLAAPSKVTDAVHAQWIKPKNSNCQPVLLTFDRSSPPPAIEVPGERNNVKVYDYISRPLSCVNCLEYSHSKKKCENPARCKKCSMLHTPDQCSSPTELCYHCNGPHQALTRNCPKQKQQQEVTAIQHKEKVSWPEAWQKFASHNPAFRMSYADKVRSSTVQAPTDKTPISHTQTPSENKRPKRDRLSESSEEDADRTSKKGKSSLKDDPQIIDTDLIETSETCEEIRREAEQIFMELP